MIIAGFERRMVNLKWWWVGSGRVGWLGLLNLVRGYGLRERERERERRMKEKKKKKKSNGVTNRLGIRIKMVTF